MSSEDVNEWKIDLDEIKQFRSPSSVSMGLETGMSRDDRFALNKLRSNYLQQLNSLPKPPEES